MVGAGLGDRLAALVGIAIVALGGGGIKTMSQRWEAVAARYDEEKPRPAAAVRNSPSLPEQARQASAQARQYAGDDRGPSYGASTPGPQSTRPYSQRRDDLGPGRRVLVVRERAQRGGQRAVIRPCAGRPVVGFRPARAQRCGIRPSLLCVY
jgi:hypothetical protein